MDSMGLTVYLSGEIHSDWREQIETGTEKAGLPIAFLSPVTDHGASDDCGVKILGEEVKARRNEAINLKAKLLEGVTEH